MVREHADANSGARIAHDLQMITLPIGANNLAALAATQAILRLSRAAKSSQRRIGDHQVADAGA